MHLQDGDGQSMKPVGATISYPRPRCLPLWACGVFRHIVLITLLFFAAMTFAPASAQAHGLHATGIVAETDTESADARLTVEWADCGIACCSSVTCAVAVLSPSVPLDGVAAPAPSYAWPADERAEAQSQAALKRPPRL